MPVDTDTVIHNMRVELTHQILRVTESHEMERVARIELASLAWKAKVLPLHNTRIASIIHSRIQIMELA